MPRTSSGREPSPRDAWPMTSTPTATRTSATRRARALSRRRASSSAATEPTPARRTSSSISPASMSSESSNSSLSCGSRRVSEMKSRPCTRKAPAMAMRWVRTCGRSVVGALTGPSWPGGAPPSGCHADYAGAVTLRIRIDLSYDGTAFSGWAAQPGRRTVEGVLSEALTTILRSPEPVRLVVAGRTDAGVHARGQVAHADIDEQAWDAVSGRSARAPEEAAATRLRGILPADIGRPGRDARPGGVRRPVLGAAPSVPLPAVRRPGAARPAAPSRHRARPRPARRRAHGRGGADPARAARLRGLLPAS